MRSRLVAVGLAVVPASSSMLASLTAQASDEPGVRVEYDPPHVSVAATEVGLGELLRLIGAKVGFSVAEGRAALRLITVSIASASLADVLQSQAVAGLPQQPAAVPEPAAPSATGR
jgi:hypothetical protein